MTDKTATITQAGSPDLAIPSREAEESNFHYLERLMAMLPEPEGDGADLLIGKILGAESMQEENDVWETTSSRELVGKRYVFEAVAARPSGVGQGLQYFLVCTVTDCDTGERDTITTGSLNIVASLMRRVLSGDLPAVATIEGPKRQLESGRIPLHLRWEGKMAG